MKGISILQTPKLGYGSVSASQMCPPQWLSTKRAGEAVGVRVMRSYLMWLDVKCWPLPAPLPANLYLNLNTTEGRSLVKYKYIISKRNSLWRSEQKLTPQR